MDLRDSALTTFGGYRIYQNHESTSDIIDPAKGFYSGMWIGFTSEYQPGIDFTVTAPTFYDLFVYGSNDVDNPYCWVPNDTEFQISSGQWLCYSLCPIGTYINGDECTACQPS